jgi:hypothetical protein
MFDERLSNLRPFYCGSADAGQIFRPISLNRPTIRLNRAKNLPRPRDSSLRTRKSDSLLGLTFREDYHGVARLVTEYGRSEALDHEPVGGATIQTQPREAGVSLNRRFFSLCRRDGTLALLFEMNLLLADRPEGVDSLENVRELLRARIRGGARLPT